MSSERIVEKAVLWILAVLSATTPMTASNLAEAKRAFEQEDFERAARLFSSIPDGPDRCEAALNEGLSLFELRRLNESIIALESAVVCDQSAIPRLAIAQAWLAKGEDNRAGAALEAALQLDPGNAAALRALSTLYLRNELNDKAVAVLERLLTHGPRDAQAHADLAAAYAGSVNYERARAEFEEALKINGKHAGALMGLANVLIKTDQPEQALTLLDQALRIQAGAYETHFLRGLALSKMQRTSEDVDSFQRALQLGGEDPDILYQLSRAYRALGRDPESRSALERFSSLRQNTQSLQEAKREGARLMLQAAPLVDKGEVHEATALVEKAYRLDPGNPNIIFRLAGLQYDAGKFDLARASVVQALQIVPSEWMYHYLLGLIETDTNHADAARRSFETSARLNPSAADVQNALGSLAARRGDMNSAVSFFDRAVSLRPEDSTFRRNLEAAKASVPKR